MVRRRAPPHLLLAPLAFVALTCALALPARAAQAAGDAEVESLAAKAGTADAAGALARLIEFALASSDPARATAATERLESFGLDGQAALERILRESLCVPARGRALDRIAARHRPEDGALITAIALADVPVSLRMQALDLVPREPELLDRLESLIVFGEPRVAAKTLRLLGRARRPAAVARATALLATDAHATALLKIAAIEVLREDGQPLSIRTLVEAAGREIGDVQEFALKSLQVMDHGAVLLLLLPRLSPTAESADARVAIELLGRARGEPLPEIATALRRMLDHRDPDVKAAAARALGAIGDHDSVPQLERTLATAEPLVAAAAVEALDQLRRGEPNWRERLLRLSHAPKTAIRLAAIAALSQAGDPTLAPLLITLLDDPDWRVREVVAEGLGLLRARSAIDPLIAHLDRDRRRVRGAIVHALRRTCGMPFLDSPRTWRRWWSDHRDDFQVPPLADVEAMEKRLVDGDARNTTHATFYGIPVESDHLALVIDVSGSMAEPDRAERSTPPSGADPAIPDATKLDVAKHEVEQLISQLPDGAGLNLLFFSDDVQRWSQSLVEVNSTKAARAAAFTRERRAGGATNLYEGLIQALGDPQIDTIYLLSDGEPTAGKIVDPMRLRAEVRRQNEVRRVKIHSISLGRASELLERIAADSGGIYSQR